jgi:hypothetical protein
MSSSYAIHFLSFRAQNYALNLFVKDFLLHRSLEVTERVLLNTIQDAAQGTSKFRIEDQNVFYEKKFLSREHRDQIDKASDSIHTESRFASSVICILNTLSSHTYLNTFCRAGFVSRNLALKTLLPVCCAGFTIA